MSLESSSLSEEETSYSSPRTDVQLYHVVHAIVRGGSSLARLFTLPPKYRRVGSESYFGLQFNGICLPTSATFLWINPIMRDFERGLLRIGGRGATRGAGHTGRRRARVTVLRDSARDQLVDAPRALRLPPRSATSQWIGCRPDRTCAARTADRRPIRTRVPVTAVAGVPQQLIRRQHDLQNVVCAPNLSLPLDCRRQPRGGKLQVATALIRLSRRRPLLLRSTRGWRWARPSRSLPAASP